MTRKHITPEQIKAIMALHKQERSSRSIALELGMARSTVSNIISKNSFTIGGPKAVAREKKQAISKTAKPVKVKETIYTSAPFVIPDGAPICNATATGIYRGEELSYRKPSAR